MTSLPEKSAPRSSVTSRVAGIAVQPRRLVGLRGEFREHALRLAQCIAEQDRRFAAVRAFVAPGDDVACDLGSVGPAVDRQAEGCFGNEGIARHDLERRAGRIVLALIVAGYHPDLAIDFDADLRRTQHMARRMQGNARIAERERLAMFVSVIGLVA